MTNTSVNTEITTHVETLRQFLASPQAELPFYNQSTVWANNRTGDDSTRISLQRSKIFRAFFGAQDWDVKLNLKNNANR